MKKYVYKEGNELDNFVKGKTKDTMLIMSAAPGKQYIGKLLKTYLLFYAKLLEDYEEEGPSKTESVSPSVERAHDQVCLLESKEKRDKNEPRMIKSSNCKRFLMALPPRKENSAMTNTEQVKDDSDSNDE